MNPFLTLAITILVLLVVLFVVSYVLNKRTPVPKGCEQIKISDEFCLNCTNTECKIHEKLDLEKIQKELESEDDQE
ncbi:MAG: hypothetical protein K2N65_05635 [Anaeroplasmataceae bacterium]|nr:hypothetical protein [Anaeroplasmataceae bacterium]